MLLTVNRHELDAMKTFAESVKAKFRFDPMVGPRLDGGLSPLQYRVRPEEAVAMEMRDPERVRRRVEYAKLVRSPYRQEYLYRCGTGTTAFFVDAFGRLQPCLMVTEPALDIRYRSFAEAWCELAGIRSIEAPPDKPCRTCEDLPYCGYCPPVMKLENAMQVGPGNFICQLGRARHRAALAALEEA
jgi:radical SAM protein with 4Fe4S-binding SPASM domain